MELKPNSIHSCVRGIQCAFSVYCRYEVQLLTGLIFNDPDPELKTVLDRNCRQLQGKGLIGQGHNVLSDDDVVKLYNPEDCRQDDPHGLILRVILNLKLATALRPLMLEKLKMHQLSDTTACGRTSIRFKL